MTPTEVLRWKHSPKLAEISGVRRFLSRRAAIATPICTGFPISGRTLGVKCKQSSLGDQQIGAHTRLELLDLFNHATSSSEELACIVKCLSTFSAPILADRRLLPALGQRINQRVSGRPGRHTASAGPPLACYCYCNRLSTRAGFWLACARAAVPACCRILLRVAFVDSTA